MRQTAGAPPSGTSRNHPGPRSSAAAPTSPGTRSASSWPTSPILGPPSSSRASCLPRRAILRRASARSERRAALSAGASIRPSGMWSPPTWSAGSGSSSRLGSCWRRRRFRQVGALDLPRLVDLEDVAFLHVVEALEQDPALEALGDLTTVVLKALQLRDRGLLDDRAVADDPHRCAAADVALGHVAARDRAESRDPEQGPDLDLADRLLGRDWAEHADERLLDVLGQLVDNAVGADLDALALGELARLG